MAKRLLAKLFIASALVGSFQTVKAQDADSEETTGKLVYHLLVVHKDGSEVKVPFEENPQFYHDGTSLQLSSDSQSIEYPTGSLDHFKILAEKSGDSGVGQVSAIDTTKPAVDGGNVTVSNGKAGDRLVVVTVDGKTVAAATVGESGEAAVSIEALAPGIYIIQSGKTAFKYLKK